MIHNFPFWLFLGSFFAGLGIWFLTKKGSKTFFLLSLSVFFIMLFTGLVLGEISPGAWPLYILWTIFLTGYFYLAVRWPLAAVWPGLLLLSVTLVVYTPAVMGMPRTADRNEIRLVCLPSAADTVSLRIETTDLDPEIITLKGREIHPLYLRITMHPFLFWKKAQTTYLAGIATSPVYIPGVIEGTETVYLFPEFKNLSSKNLFRSPGLTLSYPSEKVLKPGDYYSFTLIPGGRDPIVLHR